jgi:hypothetical protein
MRQLLSSIESEYRRYKKLSEDAMAQVSDTDLAAQVTGDNSIAIIARHVGGNLKSRFTDFLTTDGEKPWRDRESEFEQRAPTRAELLGHWEDGWQTLFSTLASLTDDQLNATITIRGESLTAIDALHRSLAHTSYHSGQIVFIAKSIRGADWRNLSIPLASKRK